MCDIGVLILELTLTNVVVNFAQPAPYLLQLGVCSFEIPGTLIAFPVSLSFVT